MDRLSGHFDASDVSDVSNDYDLGDEDFARDLPPAAIGQDERRIVAELPSDRAVGEKLPGGRIPDPDRKKPPGGLCGPRQD